ncbi:hypothetical protein LTR08_004793 [Meristemomyces frigidus]|nr:hypothetical protein LTR08_004793 [Meristemomyces frigidus]
MKHPDLLSAADRCLHNNIAVSANEISELKQAFMKFASVRFTGRSKATAREMDSPAVLDENAGITLQLDQEDFIGVLRDQMTQLKEDRNKLTRNRGNPAKEQAKAFLKKLGDLANGESDEAASVRIYALATSLPEDGLTDGSSTWAGRKPATATPTPAVTGTGGGTTGRKRKADELPTGAGSPAKRTRAAAKPSVDKGANVEDDEDDDEDEDYEDEGEGDREGEGEAAETGADDVSMID